MLALPLQPWLLLRLVSSIPFIFSVRLTVNALFSVDVSVGVVVACNLRTFFPFGVPTSFVRSFDTFL